MDSRLNSLSKWREGLTGATTLLTRSETRTGFVTAVTVTSEFQILLAISRGCHDMIGDGFIERYPAIADADSAGHVPYQYHVSRWVGT